MATFRCPFCPVTYTWGAQASVALGQDAEGHQLRIEGCPCTNCGRWSLRLIATEISTDGVHEGDPRLIWPRATNRSPLPAEVPARIADLYRQAALTLLDSPMASAALSRRGLQEVLRDKGGITKGNLAEEIDRVEQKVPAYLFKVLDEVRVIGNFAAHPEKSQHTSEVIEVEPGEAEWNLDALDRVFDFYYVQPIRAAERRAKINKKLTEAGKKPIT